MICEKLHHKECTLSDDCFDEFWSSGSQDIDIYPVRAHAQQG